MQHFYEKSLVDIVETSNSEQAINAIVDGFCKTQEKRGFTVSEFQKENIEVLATLVYCENKDDIPVIVADLDMALGKSTLLVEFIKYMHQNDPNFGCIVVKKKISECHEFCINVGYEESNLTQEQKTIDEVDLKNIYDKNEDKFIARTIRGFNYDECNVYHGKGIIGNSEVVAYDYRLCSECNENKRCKVYTSRFHADKHSIIAISHQRLFSSNDYEGLLSSLLYFGENKKRRMLIIDEKIDMAVVESISFKEFKSLKAMLDEKSYLDTKEYRKLFVRITKYLDKLEYPESFDASCIKQTKKFIKFNGFNEEMKSAIFKDRDFSLEKIIAFNTLEKILLNPKNITTSIKYKFASSKKNIVNNKQISVYRYIDLNNYTKHFEKTIVMDATARLDKDYNKSNLTYCSQITHQKPCINVFTPLNQFNVTKYKLNGSELGKGSTTQDRQEHYEEKVQNIALECKEIIYNNRDKKSLIVVYQTVKGSKIFEFKDDIISELKNLSIDKSLYKVIHHGQYNTGVNHLSAYDNIVIIGQLNKSSSYYENKALALGKEIKDEREIMMNDYLINTIQQVGRTSLRQGNLVNVYLLDKIETTNALLSKMEEYFDISSYNFENNYYKKTYDSTLRRDKNEFGHSLHKLLNEVIEGKHKEFEDAQKPNHYSRTWCKSIIGYEGDQFKRDTIDNFDRNKQLLDAGIFIITGSHIIVQNS